ncbi:diguanylate cyclase [Alteromonas halophila]|uniref:diguanylate cyclase n=1 Tax=Alteromonas halophila TaxID=516698 RepID=A0A918MZA3_9ALTE|nr:diguanylate cyclase [Alteromonas halophila]GGW84483.1 diguanylate cyclase response regulator [Alteromonas halophila]
MAVNGIVGKSAEIESFLEKGSEHGSVILIVDDELINATILKNMLSTDYQCILASSGQEAVAICEDTHIDLVLLDMHMPGMNGVDVCTSLKKRARTRSIPVIFVTGSDEIETQNQCWEAGATDFLLKPVVLSTLLHRVSNHLLNKRRIELLQSLIYKDQLTGIYNRYYFNNELPRLLRQVVRDKGNVCAVMLDIDLFKKYNDTYGHVAGDEVISGVSQAIQKALRRPTDSAIRFGGEEFVLFLPYTGASGGQRVVEKVLQAVSQLQIEHALSPHGIVTVSAGIYAAPADENTALDDLISNADEGLYEAKENGRNRLVNKSDISTMA